ncbi:TonB-dependent receptor [Novosphingobium cyanobacteriorum]|uniref:TonB-dependent receptor n=1 Tax=Novosphingobium cyanobacteriorum TaxID=3024215 RepID=A0ABT6CNM6_9SPHN|nr:TonB-dependent receptor [Novosphingobium cyanobacteriorum]MDF8335519.1 TonB-dependent receptor [Novosphingobium cyanobacteriorum]
MLKIRSALFMSVAALAFAPPAAAQEAATSGDAAVGAGEIIVTAQKRQESVQNIPAAITALTADALAQRGASTANSLQFIVPSTQIGNLLGQTAVTIRGVGLNQGAPGVAIHVDGVYQARPSMGDLLQVDLERVEVLRGPQGTLYGRNANGGVVNFITKAPTDKFEGYALASYGNYDEARLQGVVNIPVSEGVRARLLLDWTKRGDGFIKNIIPGGQDLDKAETMSGRLRVDLLPTSNLKIELKGEFLNSDGPSQYFTLHNYPAPFAIYLNPVLATATYSFEPWRTSANDPVNTRRRYLGLSAVTTLDLGKVTLKSISGYNKLTDDSLSDDDGINVSMFPVRRAYFSKTFTQEFNAAYSDKMVDAVAGVFYLNDKLDHTLDHNLKEGFAVTLLPDNGLPPGSQLLFRIPDYRSEVKAAFADVTLHPTDRLSLIAGVRYSKEKQSQTQQNNITWGPGAPIYTCPLRTNDVEFTSTTPRFGARYEVSSDANVYATFSKGFKAGGFNLYACDNQFNPEKLTAYEGGVKLRLLDRTLTLNLSAFKYDYDNLQISQVIGLARFITNAAAAKVKGLEIETAWRPDRHWMFDANVSLLDAKYASFSNVDGMNPALGVQVLDGKRLSQAPQFSSNIGLGYRTTPGAFGTFTIRADVSQRSTVFFREFNGPLDAQGSYALLDMGLVWDSPNDRLHVRVYGRNLTNKAYIAQMDASDSFGARFVTWGAPRQYGIEAKVNF